MVIECSICFEVLGNSSKLEVVATTCGHLFHRLCINDWLTRTQNCPDCCVATCREDLRQIYLRNMDHHKMQQIIRKNQKLQDRMEQRDKEIAKFGKEAEIILQMLQMQFKELVESLKGLKVALQKMLFMLHDSQYISTRDLEKFLETINR